MKPAPALPKKFKFGPFQFSIRLVDSPGRERSEDGEALNDGFTDMSNCIMYISKNLAPYMTAVTIHHECGHVIRHVFGGTETANSEKQEEHNVNIYSVGYIMLEQDNPNLMEYFDYYLRNKR